MFPCESECEENRRRDPRRSDDTTACQWRGVGTGAHDEQSQYKGRRVELPGDCGRCADSAGYNWCAGSTEWNQLSGGGCDSAAAVGIANPARRTNTCSTNWCMKKTLSSVMLNVNVAKFDSGIYLRRSLLQRA